MTDCCPTCGQDLPEMQLKVDLTQNMLLYGLRAVPLTAGQAAIAFTLAKAAPKTVPHEHLRMAMYGGGYGAKDEDGTISILIRRIRMKIAPVGLAIKSVRGVGYHFAPATPAQEPPKRPEWTKWTPEKVEQFHKLCSENVPRDLIAERLGWTLSQVKGLDKYLRRNGLSRYRLPYSSGIARRRYAA